MNSYEIKVFVYSPLDKGDLADDVLSGLDRLVDKNSISEDYVLCIEDQVDIIEE